MTMKLPPFYYRKRLPVGYTTRTLYGYDFISSTVADNGWLRQ